CAGNGSLCRQEGLLTATGGRSVLIIPTPPAGTTRVMGMGELITKRGIGNGISLLIFASILSTIPAGIPAWLNGGSTEKLFLPVIALRGGVAVVFIPEGERRSPVADPQRLGGRRVGG